MAKNDNELREVKVNLGGVLVNARMDDEGNIIIPDEAKEVLASSLSIIEQAKEGIVSDKQEDPPAPKDPKDIAADFKGLPMRELIGAPLFAAAEAQQKLASIALDYYNRVAFYNNGEEIPTGKNKGDTRILKFTIKRPIEKHGKLELVEQTIEAPFLGLVPVPSLLIDRIDVDFQMEVTNTNVNKTDTQATVETSASAKWFAVQASVSGKVSTSRENTRTTNQTAKYQVHVTASQQQQTEGLSKLMDIMASCIEPVTVDEDGK